MNDKGIKQAIRKRVDSLPLDFVFAPSDFLDIAGEDSIWQTLKELTDNGLIERIERGIYYKPRYNTLLDKTVPPDIDAVAQAIARSKNWIIAPSGDTALNKLGLDTQVPAVYSYVSNGPYYTRAIGPYTLRFKHAANKDITSMSQTTLLVVQAIKALGKDRITEKEITIIAARLTQKEKELLLKEGLRTTAWIRAAIKRISQEKAL